MNILDKIFWVVIGCLIGNAIILITEIWGLITEIWEKKE